VIKLLVKIKANPGQWGACWFLVEKESKSNLKSYIDFKDLKGIILTGEFAGKHGILDEEQVDLEPYILYEAEMDLFVKINENPYYWTKSAGYMIETLKRAGLVVTDKNIITSEGEKVLSALEEFIWEVNG
jgi:hypothetical protein